MTTNWVAANAREDNRMMTLSRNEMRRADGYSPAIELIAVERQRQMTDEGWTPAHDDEHKGGQLADAAACYAHNAKSERQSAPPGWPWDEKWWKPCSRKRMLIKAGALIVAEIDRLDRNERSEVKKAVE